MAPDHTSSHRAHHVAANTPPCPVMARRVSFRPCLPSSPRPTSVLLLNGAELHLHPRRDVANERRELGHSSPDDYGLQEGEEGGLNVVDGGEGAQGRRGEGELEAPPVCAHEVLSAASFIAASETPREGDGAQMKTPMASNGATNPS